MFKIRAWQDFGEYISVPGFFFGWKLVPALCGRKTPVPPRGFWEESRKMACIPCPPETQFRTPFDLLI